MQVLSYYRLTHVFPRTTTRHEFVPYRKKYFPSETQELVAYDYEASGYLTLRETRLVGHWRLDEGIGFTAYDSSIYGRHGTENMASATYTSGATPIDFPNAYALIFVGNDYIEIPIAGLLNPNFTLSLWAKPDSLPITGS